MKNFHLYLGKAGHMYAMSEFLMRGWNVAIPEVDVGDDIFVVKDENSMLKRVQVKTSTATEQAKGFTGQFNIPIIQLQNYRIESPIYYVFVIRHRGTWTKPLIIKQGLLFDYFNNGEMGSRHKGNVNFYFSYKDDKVICSGIDLTEYIDDFKDFPISTDTNELPSLH